MWHTQGVPKRPRDPNQLAKLIVDIATGDVEDKVSQSKRNPSPKRKGGLKLQHKTGRYDLFRNHLVKIRSAIAPNAVVDGWGDVTPIDKATPTVQG